MKKCTCWVSKCVISASSALLICGLASCDMEPRELFPIKKIKPAVVLLSTIDSKGNVIGTATGFWVSKDGKLVSSYHAIENASQMKARTADGASYDVMGIHYVDTNSDVVILQTGGANLPSLALAASDEVKEGERIVVVGNPLGLEGTVSEGVVSARRILHDGSEVVQLTAAISPGSSGSPVLNSAGEVIGVARMTLRGGQSLNFAVPISKVREGLRHANGNLAELGTLHNTIRVGHKTLCLPKSDWVPMENTTDSAVSYHARKLGPRHRYQQVITVHKLPMSDDRRVGDRISTTEYCELFWLGWVPAIGDSKGEPGYLVIQLRVEKEDYWVLSRECFEIPNVTQELVEKFTQTAISYSAARNMLPAFDLQEVVDRTRHLIRQDF